MKALMGPAIISLLVLTIQFLGHATTCTQGDSDSAMVGAIYSGPLLIVLIGLIVYRLWVRRETSYVPYIVIAVLVGSTTLNFDIWFDTFVYATPCGEFFRGYAIAIGSRVVILSSYVALPLLVMLLCLGWIVVSMTSWRKSKQPTPPRN